MKQSAFITFAVLAIGFLLYINYAQKKEPGFVKGVIYTDKAPKPIGPYSQAILTGNTLLMVLTTDMILSLVNSFAFLERRNLIVPILIHTFYNLSIILFI